MKPTPQFNKLYSFLQEHSSHISEIYDRYAWGKLLGCHWRLFQEYSFPEKKQVAWVGIKDETVIDSKWPAFYTIQQIEEWMEQHKRKGDRL